MAELILDKGKTALLMADFHTDSMGENPIVRERHTFERAKEVLDAARDSVVFVAYIVVNFRQGFPEISDFNKTFSSRKTSGQSPASDPLALIHPTVTPRQDEPVVVKHRVNAFFGTDLDIILRSHGIDTLILMGHATSGVILSPVRYAADADYEDGCADREPEVHTLLMEKVFPRQATVTSSKDVVGALAAS